MYPYSYNIPQFKQNMYRGQNMMYQTGNNDQRFFAGGLVAPLLLGGVAGYALGTTNRPNYYYQQPYYYYPPTTYYNNNYYYPYY